MLKRMEEEHRAIYRKAMDVDLNSLANMPNDEATKEAYSWLAAHIKVVADHVPNRKQQVNIDFRTKVDIHNEYSATMRLRGKEPISYERFRKLWKRCFQHVRIRKFKTLQGLF
jgi:hypothetical protein